MYMTECVGGGGRVQGHQRELAAGKAMPVARTDRLTRQKSLGCPDRIKAGERHIATGRQEQAILEVRDRSLVRSLA